LPVIQIFGSSMEPTLHEGDLVVAMRYVEPGRGDIIAFYSGEKILVKRVIGLSEEWVDINPDGDVYINGVLLQEPYLAEKAFGECSIKLHCQVPKGKVFVITGSINHFSNRTELKELIESKGGKVTGSVTGKTDYLINNDTASGSSKNKKAKELGVAIISEEEFLTL